VRCKFHKKFAAWKILVIKPEWFALHTRDYQSESLFFGLPAIAGQGFAEWPPTIKNQSVERNFREFFLSNAFFI
jgi:hypothetical protein